MTYYVFLLSHYGITDTEMATRDGDEIASAQRDVDTDTQNDDVHL